MNSLGRPIVAALMWACVPIALAQDAAPSLQDCARLEEAAARLACYDRLAATAATLTSPLTPAASAPPAPQALPAPAEPAASAATHQFQGLRAPGWMTRDWELDDAHKRGTFRFFMY